MLTILFADGSTITYECTLPTAMRQLRDRLITLAEETPAQRAEDACKAAAPHDFFSAEATTVGAIHAIPGPVNSSLHAFASVLRGSPNDAVAAWCWRQPTPHHYVSYVVGPNAEVVHDLGGSIGEPPPSPGPLIPT